MTITTPNNGNDHAHAITPMEDATGLIIAFVVVSPLLCGVLWVTFNLIKLAGVLDQV